MAFTTELENRLECDDDMSDSGHGVRGLSVDSEVVISPEDVWFIRLGGRAEGWRIYRRMDRCVDDPAHGTSWPLNEGHEGAVETS